MYLKLKERMRAFLITVLSGMLMILSVNAQTGKTINVKGNVKDVAGEPLIGVNILVRGTSTGTVTDYDGNYVLQAPSDGVLEVSYIGYKAQSIPIDNRTQIDIVMAEDSELLEEVVVIGYGTVKKDDATGSVVAIKPEQMNKGLTVNAQDMLSGKVAGVHVTSHGGTPGGGATIRIRGGSSLNASNDPLIVIDGLTMDNNGIQGVANFLSTINPNDIESFTVLKDASATAIYGSRASNGVILITTKHGSENTKPQVSYNGSSHVSVIKRMMDVLNADEFTTYVKDLYADDAAIISKLGTANTDWQKQIYQTALGTDHNVNITGGFKKVPYRVSLGTTHQNGILKTSNFHRYTGAVSVSPSLLDDHLKVNVNLKGMLIQNRFADTGAIGAAISMDPTQPIYGEGEPYQSKFGGYWQWYLTEKVEDMEVFKSVNADAPRNPVALLDQRNDRSKAYDVIGNIEFDYKCHFLPELHAHLNLATDISHGRQDTWVSELSGTNSLQGGYDGYTIQDKWNRLLNGYLQYSKDLDNQHFDIMGGYEWQRFHREGTYDAKPLKGSYIYQENPIDWATHSQLISFFGRMNYSLLNRYLFTATLRADGSSRFAPGNKWSYFPSFAFAWKINNEAFLADNNKINDLKLRLGYGKTGQQDIGADFPYLPVYTINKDGAFYRFGDTFFQTARPDAYNKKLKWEETTTYNAGIDIALMNNRYIASLDYYYRVTDNLLNITPIPAGTNFRNKVLQNVGSLNNRGIELMLGAKLIARKDLTWDVSYNFTYNRNNITKLTTGNQQDYYVPTGGIFQGDVQAHAVGYPAGSFFVYQQVYDNEGKPIEGLYVDRNGDGIINDKDKYFFHNGTPDYTMGLSSKVIYNHFDFGISIRSNLGNYIYNSVDAERLNVGKSGIWSTLGFFSNKPRSAFNTNFSGGEKSYLSDYYVQNASFARIDNITAGYSFDKLFGFISGGRLSLTVQNPLVITAYKGLDPEVFGGIDGNIYPKPIMTVLGLTLNF